MCKNMLFTLTSLLTNVDFGVVCWGFLWVFLGFFAVRVFWKKTEADAVIGDCRPKFLHALISSKNNEVGF